MKRMAHIISSRNLFIDTSADLNGSQGDNITLQFGADSIHAASGQQLKLTLSYFSMYRNWYSININNSKVRLTTDSNATELVIPSSNCQNAIEEAVVRSSLKNRTLGLSMRMRMCMRERNGRDVRHKT